MDAPFLTSPTNASTRPTRPSQECLFEPPRSVNMDSTRSLSRSHVRQAISALLLAEYSGEPISAERSHPRNAVYGLLGLLSRKLPGTDLCLFKVDYGIKTVPVLTKLWQLSMKTYRLLDSSSHLADRSTWKRQGLPSCGPDSAAFYYGFKYSPTICYAGLSEGNSSSCHSQIADFFQYEALMVF